jgi:hypothetical protein
MREEDGYAQHHGVRNRVSLVDRWSRPVWPGVRQAGLLKAEPGADDGPGAAQRRRLDPVRPYSAVHRHRSRPRRQLNSRPSVFQGTELPRPDQAQRNAAGRPGHVSGMIKHSEPI